eukprot:12924341-Prorocentrum_lima.AAC.1
MTSWPLPKAWRKESANKSVDSEWESPLLKASQPCWLFQGGLGPKSLRRIIYVDAQAVPFGPSLGTCIERRYKHLGRIVS